MAKFFILQEYLKGINFASPQAPGIFFAENGACQISTSIDVQSRSSEQDLYDVTVIVKMAASSQTDNAEIFSVTYEFGSLVQISTEDWQTEEILRWILSVEVPKSSFPFIRSRINQTIADAGFPPVDLKNFDFEEHYRSKYLNSGGSGRAEDAYGYESVVRSLGKTVEGQNMLQAFSLHGRKPEMPFSKTMMYKYFFRFITPVKLSCPIFTNMAVSGSFWDTFYRLIVSDTDFGVRLEQNGGDSSVEMFITGANLDNAKLSSMSFGEVDAVMRKLVMDAWMNRELPLVAAHGDEESADRYIEESGVLTLPTEDEFREIFFRLENGQELFDELIVRDWFANLEEIDISSMPYRF